MAENKDGQFDMTLMKQVQERAQYLKSLHSKRNLMDDRMEQAFLLSWDEETRTRRVMENVKITKHPGARNALLGAMRLLIASDPRFNVPRETNDEQAATESEPIEKFADVMWKMAGRVRQQPVHYDVVMSILTFAEAHIAVTKTADMVEAAKGGTKAAQVKAENIAALTPYVFDVWDPRTGYPELDNFGLTAFYREVATTSGTVLDQFGDAARSVFKDSSKRYDAVTLCHFWDYENRFVWVNSQDRPLIQEKHGLPFIPVVVQVGEGSRIFSKPEYQRQPFLYTMIESGLWSRQNLMLTVLYTLAFAIGSNPLYVYQANQPGKQMTIDWSKPGGVAVIEANESLAPMLKQVLDPSLMTGYDISTRLAEESTIYGQTLGEPLGSNAPFSMAALMHQAGRLPLVVPQKLASWAIADAVKMALLWMKADGGKAKAGYKYKAAELKAADIPDSLDIEADLDIDLPQDMLQQANVYNLLTGGDNPAVSAEWGREKILKINRPKEVQKQIWSERAGLTEFMNYLQDQIAVMQQRQQPPKQPLQQPQQMQGQPQGLPPEMMQGGMQPPAPMPGQPGPPPLERGVNNRQRIPPEMLR
jgi:hypothetical protein